MLILGAAPAAAQTGASAAANRQVAAHAAALLQEQYVVPAAGARYAAALRAHATEGDYDAIRDPQTLADRLTKDLQAVAPDGHLRFYRMQPAGPPPPPTAAEIAAGQRSIAPGIRAMKWVAPGVAYLSFAGFDDGPEAMGAVAGFLRDYALARALVIDSRDNGGGAFDMMGLLANHVFAAPRHLANMDVARAVVTAHGAPFPVDGKMLRRADAPDGLVRFEYWSVPASDTTAWFAVPIYYLTSRRTFSAAEHMAMILKSTRRATLIDEPTGGGNHFGGTEPVGEGLELFVPVGHTTDPATGRDWEGVGIAPDVAMPADRALDEALRRIDAAAPR